MPLQSQSGLGSTSSASSSNRMHTYSNSSSSKDENTKNVAATKTWILASTNNKNSHKNTTNSRKNNDTSNNNNGKDEDSNDEDEQTWRNAPLNAGLLSNKRQRLLDVQHSHQSLRDRLFRPLWLGLGLFLVLCAFWVLDSLKDPILGVLTNANLQVHQPRAKILSVCTTLALVCFLEYVSTAQRQGSDEPDDEDEEDGERDYDDNDDTDNKVNSPTANGKGEHCDRTDEHMLDDSKPWTKMNFADDYENSAVSQDRVPSSIFAYIAIPYCVTFGIMAYLLQFHPAMSSTSYRGNGHVVHSQQDNGGLAALDDIDSNKVTFWHFVGYAFYAAVESFGSLAVATFWSYTNSTLCLDDAERYYGPIIAFAQLGAIFGSTMVTTHWWSSVTLIIVACLFILLHLIIMHLYTVRFKPTREYNKEEISELNNQEQVPPPPMRQNLPLLTVSSSPTFMDDEYDNNRNNRNKAASLQQSSWWSGVYLILQHNYVLYILGVSCLYEVSTTCLNYQMTLLGWSKFAATETEHVGMTFTQFMGRYGQLVNATSLVLSSFVFPLLIRRVGLKYTLRIFPTLLFVINIIAFGAVPGNLTVLFISLSILKAMTYSIHDPSKELLYVPTSPRIQFQAKFWIDVVGARIAKALGSSLNNFAGSVDRSVRVASAPSLLTSILLWVVCYRVGQRFELLVAQDKIVGIHALDEHGDVWLLSESEVVNDNPDSDNVDNNHNRHGMTIQNDYDDNDNLEEGDDNVFESPNSIIEMPPR